MNNKWLFLRAFLMGGALLSTLAVLGCAKQEEPEIKIGVAGPMTGDQSKMGIDVRNGAEMAVAEWNAKGGLFGKKIVLVVSDDQHDPKQAVAVANKMIHQGVAGVVGHFNSSSSIAASGVYHRADVPMITPASTNPKLTEQGFYNVFRICGRDNQQGGVAAQFIMDQLRLKRIAVLHDKTTYGQGLADEVIKALQGKVTIVYYGGVLQGDKDFRAVLTTVKGKDPELLYFGGIYPEGGLLVKQAREMGLNVPFMSGDGVIDTKFVEIAGTAAEGAYLTFSPDPRKIPGAETFLKQYQDRYGEPGPYSIYAYDATHVLLHGIEMARQTRGGAISQSIHEMVHQGAIGELRWDSKGDIRKSPYVVWITKGGYFEEYWKPGP